MSNAGHLAAAALLDRLSGSAEFAFVHDIHGAGVFYRAFPSDADARAFAATPILDGGVTYNTDDRARQCGELAVGYLATLASPTQQRCIVVVDLPYANQRVTVADGAAPVTQDIELVAREVTVESLPTNVPDDDPTCVRVETHVRALLAADTPGLTDKRVYFIDATADDTDLDDASTYECIDESSFTETVDALANIVDETTGDRLAPPTVLTHLRHVHATVDAAEHVVCWLKWSAEKDVVWLIDRTRSGE